MRPPGTALLAVTVLLTAACGDPQAASDAGEDASASSGTSAAPTAWHGCSAEDARTAGSVVAQADLDADSRKDDVLLVDEADAPCAGLVAVLGERVVGTDVGGLDLDTTSVRVVRLAKQPGEDAARELVLVGEEPHPRGGVQLHLFAASDELREVTSDGHPVLPFFATDGGGSPMTATCTPDGGVALVTATTHEPPGIVLAWDVTRTTYDIDGTTAVRTASSVVEEAAADPVLRTKMPELFDGSFFRGCGRPAR